MKKLLIIIVVLFICISLPLTGRETSDKTVFQVETKQIKLESFADSRNFTEKIYSNRELKLLSPVTGTIEKVLVIEGEWVTRGQRLVNFSKSSIQREMEKSKKDVEKWEKILTARQNWKVREKSAEKEAERNLRSAKKIFEANKRAFRQLNVKTSIEGKVQKIVSSKEFVKRGGFIAKITDDYIMKILIPQGSEKYFNEGRAIDISIKGVKGSFLGRVKKTKKDITVLVNNPKLILSNGMEARFSVTKKYRDLILLENSDLARDDGGYYVYKVKNKTGIKNYVIVRRFTDKKFLVKSGLITTDTIISPIVKSSAYKINLSRIKKIASTRKTRKKSVLRPEKIKRREIFNLKDKKMEYVISAGFSISKPSELFYSALGTESIISQYSEFYGLTETDSGIFKENFTGIPLNFTVNYRLSEDLFLKFGAEYSAIGNSSSKIFTLNWENLTEKFDYKLENKISNIMPFIGIEKRFSSFGIYALLGFNLTSLTHNRDLDYTEDGYSMKKNEEYKVSGSGIGVVLGGKYMIKVGKKNGIFIKLEYLYAKSGSFNGDRLTVSSDSDGASYSGSQSGSLYTYEYDPYGLGGFNWWELYENSPSGSTVTNEKGFSLDLSRIRLLIGFAF